MHKFVTNLKAVAAALGLEAKLAEKSLSQEEQKNIVAEYHKRHGEGSFEADKNDFEAAQKEAKANAALADTFASVAAELGVNAETAKTPEGQAEVLNAIKDLKADVAKMGAQAQEAKPEATVVAPVAVMGLHTAEAAFGIKHPFYATSKRYNKILVEGKITGKPSTADREALQADFLAYAEGMSARMRELHDAGLISGIRQGTVDLSALNSDTEIGTRQFNIRRDMLIARIITLPSLAGIFDTVSNVQSGEVITNVLLSEISQSYQAGSIYKGGAEFKPEKAVVDDAMAKVLFKDMKSLELSYLNYLNREGSDPVKWTLIEWLILKMATQIANERVTRAILGVRVEPVEGQASPANFASTGVIWRLISLFEGLKLMPFSDAALANSSAANFGDVIVAFVEKIKVVQPELGKKLTIYLNATHLPLYKKWYRATFGKDMDFEGEKNSKVPYHDNPIVWVPNMGNLKFMFASLAGNIELLQNVPGEEYDFKFERHLEEVIAYSYWKEGCGVGYAGKQFANLAALLANAAKGQYVFMNWPVITLAKDATKAVVKDSQTGADLGFLIKTGANTTATGSGSGSGSGAGGDTPVILTDIEGAEAGVVYRIECGSTDNATTIAKSGKFSEITADWEPDAVGKFIKVYYNPTTSKFIEVARG